MAVIDKKLAHNFLFTVLLILLLAVIWLLKPFLIDIVLAGVIAAFFYPVFKWIHSHIKSRAVSSFLTTLLIAAIIVGPIVQFFIYLVSKSIVAYQSLAPYLNDQGFIDTITLKGVREASLFNISGLNIGSYLGQIAQNLNTFFVSVSTYLVVGTTQLVTSFMIILLTIFYLFIEGKTFMRKIMNLTPLPNKYDTQIFETFREVSFNSLISTLLVGIFQGLLGGIAFWLIGLPGFFAGVIIAVSSVIPYVGAALIWLPVMVYLLITGSYVNAIILLIFGMVISTGDNFLRAYIIKGKTKIHELIVFFSILGGVLAMGFWGIIIGPLLMALLITVINIYEIEFKGQLEEGGEG